MKKLIATLILAGFIFGVVGCGSTTTAPAAPPTKAPGGEKKGP